MQRYRKMGENVRKGVGGGRTNSLRHRNEQYSAIKTHSFSSLLIKQVVFIWVKADDHATIAFMRKKVITLHVQ